MRFALWIFACQVLKSLTATFHIYFLASNLLEPPPPIEVLPIFEAPPPPGTHAGAAPPPTAKYPD